MEQSLSSSGRLGANDRIVSRSWWQRRPAHGAAALLLLGGVMVLAYIEAPASGTVTVNRNAIDLAQVVRAPFQDYLPVRAEAIPRENSIVAAESAGRVESVDVADGDLVRRGQKLAQLSNPDLTLQVTLQMVDLATSQSQINQQMIDLEKSEEQRERDIADAAYALHKAEQELAKKRYLRESDLINDAALQSFIDEVAYQRARLAALQAGGQKEAVRNRAQVRQIERSAAELQRSGAVIQDNLRTLLVVAPRDGRLSGFDLKPGQAVKSGDALGEVNSESSYKLKAQLDEFYLARLRIGLPAEGVLRGTAVSLRLTRIFPQVSDGRIAIEFEFTGDQPAEIRRGEAVDVKLSLGATQEALLVPSGNWLNDNGSIFVVRGNRAERRPLTIGRRTPEFAEILGGLAPGETVIINGAGNLPNARHLQISEARDHD